MHPASQVPGRANVPAASSSESVADDGGRDAGGWDAGGRDAGGRDAGGWDADERRAPALADLRAVASDAGIRRIQVLAWRDLDDPEAGGSELHVHRIAELWAKAGIEVSMRTSAISGHPAWAGRSGYSVVRKSGRYLVFPRAALSGLTGRSGRWDALVEIWNGMPFFSPLWDSGPKVVFLHHVHAEMWNMTLPGLAGSAGRLIESSIAPRFYRRTQVVTLSRSSRREIVDELGLSPEQVTVVPPGVDERFSRGGVRSRHPVVLAVGRLVPVKRFDRLIDVLASLKARHPSLEAVIVGDGYLRADLEAQVRRLGADGWLHMPGYLGEEELLAMYRRAWVLASASSREGWGMTITEAGACATPAVATDTVGHRDAIIDGVTGLLARGQGGLLSALDSILGNEILRARLGSEAAMRARTLTWEATARRTLDVVRQEVMRYRSHSFRGLVL